MKIATFGAYQICANDAMLDCFLLTVSMMFGYHRLPCHLQVSSLKQQASSVERVG
jgi:hypothetical protein